MIWTDSNRETEVQRLAKHVFYTQTNEKSAVQNTSLRFVLPGSGYEHVRRPFLEGFPLLPSKKSW